MFMVHVKGMVYHGLPISWGRSGPSSGTAETKQISPASPAPSGSIMSSKLPWQKRMDPRLRQPNGPIRPWDALGLVVSPPRGKNIHGFTATEHDLSNQNKQSTWFKQEIWWVQQQNRGFHHTKTTSWPARLGLPRHGRGMFRVWFSVCPNPFLCPWCKNARINYSPQMWWFPKMGVPPSYHLFEWDFPI